MREFTDPFTGKTLDNPTRKTYKVVYTVGEFGSEETYINTLAEGRLTKEQAKQKLLKRPAFMMNSPSDMEIRAISKVDETEPNAGGVDLPGF